MTTSTSTGGTIKTGSCCLICPDKPPSGGGVDVCNADRVTLGDTGIWIGNTTHWLSWLRTVVALREEYYAGPITVWSPASLAVRARPCFNRRAA